MRRLSHAVRIAQTAVLAMKTDLDQFATLTFESTREGVLSWNTFDERGAIAFRLLRDDARDGPWIDLARWDAHERRSFSGEHGGVRVDVDVIRALIPFDGIEVRAPGVAFNAMAFSTPQPARASLPYFGEARILDVPARSQYEVAGERGWCSPAALSMLHAYHGIDRSVAETAAAVFDRAYDGTGNWSFNVAFSGSLGLCGAVVHLRNLDHAQLLIDAGIPIAISYSWSAGELPGAPLEHSDGHLVVLCGFTAGGNCAVNDPAAENVRVVYPRSALERVWQRNKGVAYAVAPVGKDFTALVNA